MTASASTLPPPVQTSHDTHETRESRHPSPELPTHGLAISIHDVSPVTWEVTCEMLTRLEALGARHFSLLVVPNHHYRGHFLDHPEFCDWMRARVKQGDEIVVHGYHHQREPRGEDGFLARITNRFYTAGEGEFYDISGAQALRLVSTALKEFRSAGVCPTGFIAPAWLLSQPAEVALRKLGLDYTTRLTTLHDLRTQGSEYRSQSLVWSVRSAWRRGASLLWNASLARRLRGNRLLRIGIHPVDYRYKAIWRQIERLTQRALADRAPLTYQEWVDICRTTAPCLPK